MARQYSKKSIIADAGDALSDQMEKKKAAEEDASVPQGNTYQNYYQQALTDLSGGPRKINVASKWGL